MKVRKPSHTSKRKRRNPLVRRIPFIHCADFHLRPSQKKEISCSTERFELHSVGLVNARPVDLILVIDGKRVPLADGFQFPIPLVFERLNPITLWAENKSVHTRKWNRVKVALLGFEIHLTRDHQPKKSCSGNDPSSDKSAG